MSGFSSNISESEWSAAWPPCWRCGCTAWITTARWPKRLDELSPTYLPRLPIDPFDPAGKPLRFHIAKNGIPAAAGSGHRLVIYSVAEDGRDDTADGVVQTLPPEPQYGWLQWPTGRDSPDQIRDVSRWATPLPPTPSPPQNDGLLLDGGEI